MPYNCVVLIKQVPELLQKVKRLGRVNSKTLGFMPEGGFNNAFDKNSILVAHTEGALIGYILFRHRKRMGDVSITHLCVSDRHRGDGVAYSLITELKNISGDQNGISLWCRHDYEATKMWPRYGFVTRGEKKSRGGTLIYWEYENEQAPQLRLWDRGDDEGKRKTVAIDASVFFELKEYTDKASQEADLEIELKETVALLASWLEPYTEISVTAELYNEIVRSSSVIGREEARKYANSQFFKELPIDNAKFQDDLILMEAILSNKKFESDRRQIARASSGGADYFITTDQGILNASESILDKIGQKIMSPGELIVEIDSIINAGDYYPRRFSGSLIIKQQMSSDDTQEAVNDFLDSSCGEKRAGFRRQLTQLLSERERIQLEILKDETNSMIGLYAAAVKELRHHKFMAVKLFRISRTEQDSTIATEIVRRLIQESIDKECTYLSIEDKHINPHVVIALRDLGFIPGVTGWIRLTSHKVQSAHQLLVYLSSIENENSDMQIISRELSATIKAATRLRNEMLLLRAEKMIWPSKLKNLILPCYIVPIRPAYAMSLFDSDLASRDLFGAKPSLIFSRENVYYRSSRNSRIESPSRILWYVSKGKNFDGDMSIRACSYNTEVNINLPKVLYRRFHHLGVYSWEDVYDISKNNIKNPIMAIKFESTELFQSPVPFDRLQEILKTYGRPRNQIQCPVEVSDKIFWHLYMEGQ